MNQLTASFNDHIRPLLDAVDRLRHLKVMDEGILLPTIVAVGDQSSGKSSVLESLAGIDLPRGPGICTRVPLLMRLQNDVSRDEPELTLKYKGKTVETRESEITTAICEATDEIAGKNNCIENVPLTLSVKKNGPPDLTIVDLPGITRVPGPGQPRNIYEQIHDIILHYITPMESIILNVVAANVHFQTCESTRLCRQVDKSGDRTLVVVTKSDEAPEALLQKVTADFHRISLGNFCVRNGIEDESHDEARKKETLLFKSHPLLSKIDKSIVGIPMLAQKLVKIQAANVARCLPGIVDKIDNELNKNTIELNRMPVTLCTVSEATRAIVQVVGTSKASLRKILVRGEFVENSEEAQLHWTGWLAELLGNFIKELSKYPQSYSDFLEEEISILEKCKGSGLPDFVSRTAFLVLLQKKMKDVSIAPLAFAREVWGYVEEEVVRVLMRNCEDYPQLESYTRRAAQNLMEETRKKSLEHIRLLADIEKVADFTSSPDFSSMLEYAVDDKNSFVRKMRDYTHYTHRTNDSEYGDIDVDYLRARMNMVEEAFVLHKRLSAYWRCMALRLRDGVALHVLYCLKNLVETELEKFLVDEMLGAGKGDLSLLLEEAPATAHHKTERLKRRIDLLKESQAIVGSICIRMTPPPAGITFPKGQVTGY